MYRCPYQVRCDPRVFVVASAALVALSGSACKRSPVSVESQAIDAGHDSCGEEVVRNGKGHSQSARDCLWERYQASRAGELTTKAFTVEGDPIVYTIHILSGSSIELVIDSKDRFGTVGVTHFSCTSLARKPVRDHQSFIVGGCGDAGLQISIP